MPQAFCRTSTAEGSSAPAIYAFAQPSLIAHKQRKLELRAGFPTQHGNRKGKAAGYSLKAVRAAERELAEQGEAAYRTMVAAWQPKRPTSRAAKVVSVDASNGTRLMKPKG